MSIPPKNRPGPFLKSKQPSNGNGSSSRKLDEGDAATIRQLEAKLRTLKIAHSDQRRAIVNAEVNERRLATEVEQANEVFWSTLNEISKKLGIDASDTSNRWNLDFESMVFTRTSQGAVPDAATE